MRQAHVAAIGVTALATLGAGAVAHWWQCARGWDAWARFTETFIQADGRVIDYLVDDRSTSEGQAYALFFSLVANDRERFELILNWTGNNLADGDLSNNLPAWLWGQSEEGDWAVLDDNPASDADLWITYSLLEAGRLWDEPVYVEAAEKLLKMIAQRSTARIPGTGAVILPAPEGFTPEPGLWRLNPSYVPPFLLARLAQHDSDGPWREINQNHQALLRRTGDLGFAPDWISLREDGSIVEDRQSGWSGGYEAIRVYLWSGLFHQQQPVPNELAGMARLIESTQSVPERVNVKTAATEGSAPPGFHAALMPYLAAMDMPSVNVEPEELITSDGGDRPEAGEPQYYDHVLLLFAHGWKDERYSVVDNGRINTFWSRSCCELYH